MQMVSHQTIGSDVNLLFSAVFYQILTEMLFVFFLKKYCLVVIAALESMVRDFGNNAPVSAWHIKIICPERIIVNKLNRCDPFSAYLT
jgi:hypothetical protein